MADVYFSWTFPFPETEVPADLAPADMSLPDVISDAMGRCDAMVTMSRKDWLNGALVNAVAAFGGDALAFLVQDPETLPGDRSSGFQQVGALKDLLYQERWLITFLRPHALDAALAAIDAWLSMAAEQPERFVGPLVTDCVAQIAEEARDAEDLAVEGATHDDGDRPLYFFSFLKGLRTVLLKANARSEGVVHVRFVYLWRRLANTAHEGMDSAPPNVAKQ